MANKCDNKCSAMRFELNRKILMIERKKYNPGWALPAGHLDGLSAKEAARKESKEEVGLAPEKLERVLEISLPNTCKRDGGTHHYWYVFDVPKWSGELKASEEEVKKMEWKTKEEISELLAKLQNFVSAHGFFLTPEDLPKVVKKTNEDVEWKKSPGLEPPMYFLFKELKLI